MMFSLRRKGRNNNNDDKSKQPADRGRGVASTTTRKTEPAVGVAAAAAAAAENGNNSKKSGVKQPSYRAGRHGINNVGGAAATATSTTTTTTATKIIALLPSARRRRRSSNEDAEGREKTEGGDAAPTSAVDRRPRPRPRSGQQRQKQRQQRGENAISDKRNIANVEEVDEMIHVLMGEINEEAGAAAEISCALTRSVDQSTTDEDDLLAELERLSADVAPPPMVNGEDRGEGAPSSRGYESSEYGISSASAITLAFVAPSPPPRRRQYPTQQSTVPASPNAAPSSSFVPSPEIDNCDYGDDREIAHLESECVKLSEMMSQLLLYRCDRKYTQEYYDLELRLKNATEELEAAREDRNLHFCRSSGSGGVGSGPPMPSPTPPDDAHGRTSTPPANVGTANPETTMASNRRDDGGPIVDGERKHEGRSEGGGSNSVGAAVDPRRAEYRRIESKLGGLAKFSREWFRLKEELFELGIALDNHDKVDVDEEYDNDIDEEKDDTPREINVLLSSPGSTAFNKGGSCDSPLSPSTPEEETRSRPISSPSSTSHRNRLSDRSRDGGHGGSGNSYSPLSPSAPHFLALEGGEEETRSPISLPLLLPTSYRNCSHDRSLDCSHGGMSGATGGRSSFSSSSPPMTPTTVRGSLSPPPPVRRGLHEDFPLDCEIAGDSSPHRSISSGRRGGGSLSPYKPNLSIYSRVLGDDDDDDRKREEAEEKERETSRTAMDCLRAELASTTERLARLPEFSKEWFDIKTMLVGLHDQIVRLEKSDGGAVGSCGGGDPDGGGGGSQGGDSGSHATTTKNDQSYTSGWSSVWSESEDEIWSHADDLECVMVSEALKYQHSLIYDDSFDEDVAAREDSELLLMPPQSVAASGMGRLEKQDTEGEEDERLMRSKSPLSEIVTADYSAVNESRQDEAEAASMVTANNNLEIYSTQTVDSMLDEFASLLNSNHKHDDNVEKQKYNAIIIQEQWKKYLACRTLMLMRRRALRYRANRVMVADEDDDDAQKKQPPTPRQECSPWQASSAASIQNRWRVYAGCRLLISIRRRAAQYNTHIQHQRLQLNFNTVAAMIIQSHWRKIIPCREYKTQLSMAIVIQSQLRKFWLTTGTLYTYRREIVFHSSSLGLRLQRGRDGFVRVCSVAESMIESPSSSSIVRDGRIFPGDFLLAAGGIKLCCPITSNQWGDVVGWIRNAPRPMTFVVANVPSKKVAQATVVIQSRVRLWLDQCLYNRKLEEERTSREMETAESSSSYDTPEEAKVFESSTRLMQEQESTPEWDDAADRLNSIQDVLCVKRKMEYQHEEEQKEEERGCLADRDGSQDDTITNHQLNASLIREKFDQSAESPISKEEYGCTLTSLRGSLVPTLLSSPNTSPPPHGVSSKDISELTAEIETAESSSSGTLEEPDAQVLAVSSSLMQEQEFIPEWDDAADRLNPMQDVLNVKREMEYHLDDEECKDEERECLADRDDSQGDTSTNHQPPMSKEKDDSTLTSPKGLSVPTFLSSPNTSSPTQGASLPKEMSEPRVSVSKIRQIWEANASSPFSPENDVHYSRVRYEMRSPENDSRNVSLAKYQKNMDINRLLGTRTKEKMLTPVEKMVSALCSDN